MDGWMRRDGYKRRLCSLSRRSSDAFSFFFFSLSLSLSPPPAAKKIAMALAPSAAPTTSRRLALAPAGRSLIQISRCLASPSRRLGRRPAGGQRSRSRVTCGVELDFETTNYDKELVRMAGTEEVRAGGECAG